MRNAKYLQDVIEAPEAAKELTKPERLILPF